MITKEQAILLLEDEKATPVCPSTKAMSRFDNLEDPFNVPNSLSGWICHQADYRYGSLVIDAVNGCQVPSRVIYGIPKIKYPFSIDQHTGERIYDWGVIDRVEAYPKFDGTNIVAFRYYDSKGKPFTSFKLRLSPVVRNNKFGDLLDLWKEILEANPSLLKRCQDMPDTWFPTFEMYGYKNPHMIVYEEPIDFVHLCMIGQGDNRGKIDFPYVYDFVNTNRPSDTMESGSQLTEFYERMRQEAHEANLGKTEYGELLSEGYVLYAKGSKGVQLFKCKSGAVEDIAWSRCATIPKHSIETTCWNAFEHTDDVTFDVVIQLLLEDYTQELIDNYTKRITDILTYVKHQQRVKEKALEIYATLDEEVIQGGRNSIMRAMSQRFENKSSMTTVFAMLKMAGKIPEDKEE